MHLKNAGLYRSTLARFLVISPYRTLQSRAAARNHSTASEGFPLESTPYTKCELRQQTNRALTFIKTASPGEVCQLILRFSHTAEYMAEQADIANAEAQRVREAVRKIRPSKKDLRRLGKGNFAGVMTGKGILDEMEERDKKDREKAAKKTEKTTRSKKPAPRPASVTPVPVRVHPGPRVRFQLTDTPTRILRSATRSIPRLNYSLPPPTASELQDDSDLESLTSAASSDCKYRPRTTAVPGEIPNTPQLGTPRPRRLRSSK